MARIENSMKLCITIGHSSKKTGAYNKELSITEFELNEKVCDAMLDECIKRKIPCIKFYRRNGYAALPYEINKLGVTHNISIHFNSAKDKSIEGTEVLAWKGTKVSGKFAEIICDELCTQLNYKKRRKASNGVLYVSQGMNGGHILKNTTMPSILVEVNFMSNDEVVKNLDYPKIGKAIIDGYLKYLEVK